MASVLAAFFMSYRSLLVGSVLAVSLSCSPQPSFESVYDRVMPATLQAGDSIPEATSAPLITVTGKVKATQAGDRSSSNKSDSSLQAAPPPQIVMDAESLRAVGLVEYTVEDPFESAENTFRGVLFRDLLDLWQVSEDASYLTMTALNDYQIKVPISLLREYPVMMALEQNGEVMTRDYRGPAMLVAPLSQYPGAEALAHQEYWIWQLSSVHVE